MKILKVLFSLFIIVFNVKCDVYDGKLKIVNKSEEDIYLIMTDSIFLTHPVKVNNKGDTIWTHTWVVEPLDTEEVLSLGRNSWSRRVVESKKYLFIFNDSLLKQINRDSLVKNQIYSAKHLLEKKELEQNKWIINFE